MISESNLLILLISLIIVLVIGLIINLFYYLINKKNDNWKNEKIRLQRDLIKLKFSINHQNNLLLNLFDKKELSEKEDITVIVPWKNIGIDRLANCLRSLNSQDYKKSLYHVVVIDYGSETNVQLVRELCKSYNFTYIRVNNVNIWNRSHAVNIGIKNSNSRYILISDIDIIFEKNYLSICVNEMRNNPYQFLYSDVLDIPKETLKKDIDVIREYHFIKSRSKFRRFSNSVVGMGICFTLKRAFELVNGYDENYKLWGFEDIDLAERLFQIGIKLNHIGSKTSYLHQWHVPREGVGKLTYFNYIQSRNYEHYNSCHEIERNKNDWGRLVK
ncbi:MAG: glycosyltransferase [Candidatus Pacearchaeota archaeon]|jgi:predicted glycosyltransferase involved in capsule biosynthesis